ncbi:MAG TPA: DUF6152 family protein [Polyangiales bacterium]|nr:DUF6152 family protein [Polyangiales bacterium]
MWTSELPTSPGNLARTGWSKHTLKAGDKIDVEVNPLRDGQHSGSFKKATLLDTGEVRCARASPMRCPCRASRGVAAR